LKYGINFYFLFFKLIRKYIFIWFHNSIFFHTIFYTSNFAYIFIILF